MTNPANYSKTNPNPSGYTKDSKIASGYSKTSPNSSGYGLARKDTYSLLLQISDYLLLQDGSSNLVLESSYNSNAGYTKTNPNPTPYSVPL